MLDEKRLIQLGKRHSLEELEIKKEWNLTFKKWELTLMLGILTGLTLVAINNNWKYAEEVFRNMRLECEDYYRERGR